MLIGRLCQREDAAGIRCGLPAVEEREVMAFGARARVYLCEACAGGRAAAPSSSDPWSDGFGVARAQAKMALDSAIKDALRAGIALDGPAASLIGVARKALDAVDVEACRAQADPDVVRRANLLDGLAEWLTRTCGEHEEDDAMRYVQHEVLRDCLGDDGDIGSDLADDVIRVHHAALDRGRLSLRAWLNRFDTEQLARIREAVLARQKRKEREAVEGEIARKRYIVADAEEELRHATIYRAEAEARETNAKRILAEAEIAAEVERAVDHAIAPPPIPATLDAGASAP